MRLPTSDPSRHHHRPDIAEDAMLDLRDPAEPVPEVTPEPEEAEPEVEGPRLVELAHAVMVYAVRPDGLATSRAHLGDNGRAVQVAGAQPTRHRVTVRARGGDVWLSARQDAVTAGMLLVAGETMVLHTTHELWAVPAGDEPAVVDVADEFHTQPYREGARQ